MPESDRSLMEHLMDLEFSAEDQAFQREVQDWLQANFSADLEPAIHENGGRMTRDHRMQWQQRLASKGWLATNWPEEYGGKKFTSPQRHILQLEMSRAGAPMVLPFGVSMVAPVIMRFGTKEQKEKYLPPILKAEVWWCQGYSEPGSGSDLASLQCKAEDKGDHYLVNGVKTWTTLAQHADMIFCLVRTSQEEIRQLGISFLLIDMNTPGVDVKPIVTIDNPPPGYQEINTVYFQDVKVPKENLVGEEGKGWTCAKYLLEFERGNAYSPALHAAMEKVRDMAGGEQNGSGSLLEDPNFMSRFHLTEVGIMAMEATENRILGGLASGQPVGRESSILKCRGTELQQEITELALEAVGNYGIPFTSNDAFSGHNEPVVGPEYASGVMPEYLNTRKVSIYAGSNEIQRNIIAKLVLGL